jgi:hypothetical protein
MAGQKPPLKEVNKVQKLSGVADSAASPGKLSDNGVNMALIDTAKQIQHAPGNHSLLAQVAETNS